MSSQSSREYLEAKVETANSAQLHLMLLDGALRFGREAEKGVLRQDEQAYQPLLLKTMDIVEELLAGVRHAETDLNAKLAQLYTFVYSRLTSVYVNGDKTMAAEALRVLEFQRETWRQACESLSAEQAADKPSMGNGPKVKAPKPHLGGATTPVSGLSIEA